MLERMVQGEVPRKHHLALRGAAGELRHEEAWTRAGFDGPYTLAYHLGRPHLSRADRAAHGWPAPAAAAPRPVARRHYRTGDLQPGGAPIDAFRPLLWSEDLILGTAAPTAPDPVYVRNGDGDELLYAAEGGGLLLCPLGELRFERDDYLAIPKGLLHRLVPDPGPQRWLWLELADLRLPAQWLNAQGQLRMDAPYCHRDFRRVEWRPPRDEGIRRLVVKRGGAWSGFRLEGSPLDVVGWDGAVYPVAFRITDFQPRVGLVHLPPTWHGTFAARGALVCSFVPRPLDFHPEAIPCPYPHASVDVDEVILYLRGHFTSRRGIGPGSLSHHPAGVLHGPHPGAYEGSVGQRATDELAVMLDCVRPLRPTPAALEVEDLAYDESFVG